MSVGDQRLRPGTQATAHAMTAGAWRRAGSDAAGWMIHHPVLTLCIAWLLQIVYLGTLQAIGMPFGLDVWPMGEDRNWIRVLIHDSGISFAREFWRADGRNPLSPWWYALFKIPIVEFGPSMYLLRKLAELLLATGTTMLLGRLWRGRMPETALLAGLLVLCWNFNGYREQVVWVFEAALGIGLWTAFLYLKYVDDERKSAAIFGVVLIGSLVCIATYTLQAGAVLIIAAIGLCRERESQAFTLDIRRLRPAIEELALVAGVVGVFAMIWYTALPRVGEMSAFQMHMTTQGLLGSVRQLLWHSDFTSAIVTAFQTPTTLVVAVIPWVAMVVVALILRSRDRSVGSLQAAAWAATLFVCLNLPIVVLEATSSTWGPGTRSRMVYEVTTPILLVTLMGCCLASRRWRRLRLAGPPIIAIVAFSIAVPAALHYNRGLVTRTAVQRDFATQFASIAAARPDISHFVVRWSGNPEATWGSESLSDTFARTFVRERVVNLRFIRWDGPPPGEWWKERWKPRLDLEGMRYAGFLDTGPTPYSRVLFLEYGNGLLTIPPTIDEHWFHDLQATWNREEPLKQSVKAPEACPYDFHFAIAPAAGTGWSTPERMPDGSFAMWMAARAASMMVPGTCSGPVTISIMLTSAMAPDIVDGLGLEVDGQKLKLQGIEPSSWPVVLRATANLKPTTGYRTLRLTAPRTIVPEGGNRTLAVMLNQLNIAPSTK